MFTKQLLQEEPKFFRIGDFRISAQLNNTSVNGPVMIPGSFMAFEDKREGACDFRFAIDTEAKIERGRQRFQSDNFRKNAIYESEEGSLEWVSQKANGDTALDFRFSKDYSEVVLAKKDAFDGKLMAELGFMFCYAALSRDACVLHGITMEYAGRGILVLAKSGVGKSTHTRMWRDHENALIINGDRCLLRKIEGTWYAYGSPWCGTSGEYINRKVPVSDIVILDRGPENVVTRMSPFEATMRLLESIKAPNWDRNLYVKAMDYCEEVAGAFPVWHLHCTPDLEAVQVLKQVLFKER